MVAVRLLNFQRISLSNPPEPFRGPRQPPPPPLSERRRSYYILNGKEEREKKRRRRRLKSVVLVIRVITKLDLRALVEDYHYHYHVLKQLWNWPKPGVFISAQIPNGAQYIHFGECTRLGITRPNISQIIEPQNLSVDDSKQHKFCRIVRL